MFRQSPRSRNGRNKGLKIKHVLQISVLFGASVWLLYQVQHTDNKKATNISENLHKDSSGSTHMIKLGRKGLRPREKESNVQDRKETTEDEEDSENEAEEVVQGHDRDYMKHGEVENNAGTDHDDGMKKNTKKEYQEFKVEMKGDENEEAKEKENGVKNKSEGMKQTHDEGHGRKYEEATKEAIENGSKKSEEGNMKIPIKETNKESAQESKDVKEEKEDGNEMQPNPKEMVEISSPRENDDENVREENVSSEKVNDDNRRRKENGETREENENSSKGPSVDESESGSINPIHSKINEDLSSNVATVSEEEMSTTSGTKFVKNRKIGNLSSQRVWIKSVKKKTSPDLVPSLEPKKNEDK